MHDVIIVGGSYAGMSAAMQLARARKRVLVVDAGLRRNRFADHSHGFLAQDGNAPAAIADEARRQLLAYPTIRWHAGSAVDATGGIDAFAVTTNDGTVHDGRRLILAGGVVDLLPPVAGLKDQWGSGAMGCPYCHGYELDGGALAVIATGPQSVHHAIVVSEWGPTTLFTANALTLDDTQVEELTRRRIAIEPVAVTAVEGPRGKPVLRLADGRSRSHAGVFVTARVALSSDLAGRIGCALADTPVGALIAVNGGQQTSVAGVFACGDAASPMASIALAVGSGALAGAAAHRSIIFPPQEARSAA